MTVDRAKAAEAVEIFLRAVGMPIEGELIGTGGRVADAWIDELIAGARVDVDALARASLIEVGAGPHGPVVVRDIQVTSMCPHHLLPSSGVASVGFLPSRHVLGFGTISEIVAACSRRLVLQESLGAHVVRTLSDALRPEGLFCRLTLRHACFSDRGSRDTHARIDTFHTHGSFSSAERSFAWSLSEGRS